MQPAHSSTRKRDGTERRAAIAILTALLLPACLLTTACGMQGPAGAPASGSSSSHVPTTPTPTRKPNIVFILTDDLSFSMLQFMPHVRSLERHGVSFHDYFVSDSLCCPSRASIFTGRFPHNTGVFDNFGPLGGFRAFYDRGNESNTFALALQRAGYRTALMGKYLNGYLQAHVRVADGSRALDVASTHVPPGWSEWDVAGWGYPEFDYVLNENGVLHSYGHRPSDYLTNVIASKGVNFIEQAARRRTPFFLELATFSPHSPYVPAPRNASDFPGAQTPRTAQFDLPPTNAPQWLAHRPPLTSEEIARIDADFRLRAQSVEAVDQMIAELEHALRAEGVSRDTYIVFSSDNGLHMGEYRLLPGKLTAYDTDIRVPLIVTGPHVARGMRTTAMAENIDLAKTFAAIAGTTMPGDGHSLLPLFKGERISDWRDAILVEHTGPATSRLDPDRQNRLSGNPTSYEAMRTRQFLYVEYADGEREFYDMRTDQYELHNIVDQLTTSQLTLLHAQLKALERCHGESQCWAAMHVDSQSVYRARRATRHP